jgi:hypothetical protein
MTPIELGFIFLWVLTAVGAITLFVAWIDGMLDWREWLNAMAFATVGTVLLFAWILSGVWLANQYL